MSSCYDGRAGEYDEWWLGLGRVASCRNDGWDKEVAEVLALLATLPPARTLDMACGTSFPTRHLRGDVLDALSGGREQ